VVIVHYLGDGRSVWNEVTDDPAAYHRVVEDRWRRHFQVNAVGHGLRVVAYAPEVAALHRRAVHVDVCQREGSAMHQPSYRPFTENVDDPCERLGYERVIGFHRSATGAACAALAAAAAS